MKISLLAFSIICFAFTTELFIGITAAAPEPALDISGQKMRTGVKYYILPVVRGEGGGLTMKSTDRNYTCPLFAVQEKLEVLKGQPVTFIPYTANKDGVILTSIDLNIKSSLKTTTCANPVWQLCKVLTGVWFLSTGAVEGHPGVQTIVNWFKIEKADKYYVLSFCPRAICNCGTLCRELGIYIDDDGNKHLALSDKIPAFRVVFKRA